MLIYYNSKTNRFVMGAMGIKMFSDTLSDLVKLNHGEFSKYNLSSSKIDTAHVFIFQR